MIAWEPHDGGITHLTGRQDDDVSLCLMEDLSDEHVMRDPHKIDEAMRCVPCWREWHMQTAASYARQDQAEAAKPGFGPDWPAAPATLMPDPPPNLATEADRADAARWRAVAVAYESFMAGGWGSPSGVMLTVRAEYERGTGLSPEEPSA